MTANDGKNAFMRRANAQAARAADATRVHRYSVTKLDGSFIEATDTLDAASISAKVYSGSNPSEIVGVYAVGEPWPPERMYVNGERFDHVREGTP